MIEELALMDQIGTNEPRGFYEKRSSYPKVSSKNEASRRRNILYLACYSNHPWSDR